MDQSTGVSFKRGLVRGYQPALGKTLWISTQEKPVGTVLQWRCNKVHPTSAERYWYQISFYFP